MGQIRPLTRADLPRLVAIYRRAFVETPKVPDEELADYLGHVLFSNPWRADDLPSLAYEEDGEMVGAIGVTPGRLLFDGRPKRLVVASHFVVDPARRASMAGIHLLKAFLEGKQDLAVAEGNDATRKIWERFGGALSPAYSMHGVMPLRPMAHAVATAGRGGIARALAKPLDAILTRLPGPFRRRAPAFRSEELDVPAYLQALEEVTGAYRVRPTHTEESARWLFDLLARKGRFGTLRKDLLKDGDRVVGWCIWYENPGGTGQVVQVGAQPRDATDVFAWLAHEALAKGVIALACRINPDCFGAQAANVLVLSRTHPWMMLHARDPELLAVIQSARAFLSRMEGEWWIPYHDRT